MIDGPQHAAAAATTVIEHNPEHAPCHSSSSPLPHGTTAHCGNCGHHFYLKTGIAGAGAVAAWHVSFVSCYGSSVDDLQRSLQSDEAISIGQMLASSPPRYLTLSVLRL
jgi:hypothetical protein